jgi:hypothetical protein
MSGPPTIDLPEKPVPGSYRKAVLMLSSTMRRRIAAATILLAAGLGGQAALATSAFADVRDQVVRDQSNGFTNILVPDRSAPGSPIRSVPRIGQTDATPQSQVWQRQSTGAGNFALVHAPSLGSQPLCLDVQGDPATAGAALVLSPCDGSARQSWKPLSTAAFTQLQNKQSGLKAELVGGRLVQNEFPKRTDADFRERTKLQQFSIVPKTFGVGGA